MDQFTSADSPRAEAVVRDATQAASDAVDLATQSGQEAVNSGTRFAKNAVNAAGQRLGEAKIQLNTAAAKGTKYVTEQPVKAVAMAAAGGAILGLLLSSLRSHR
jgi:ElaB/YqjD/DUF883 family membrane-anchored ribosome-binding protein